MNNFVTLSHIIYERGDMLDYYVEDAIMKTKVQPYVDKHQLTNVGVFRSLINVIENSRIREILSKLGTVEIAWDNRFIVLGHEQHPFLAEVLLKGSINCLQIGVTFWSSFADDKIVEKLFETAFRDVISNISNSVIMDVDWFYLRHDEDIRHNTIKEIIYETTHKESYPYLDLDSFLAGYFKSSSSVLIMSGIPGTGKTKLIRHIIRRAVESGPDFMKMFKLKHRYDDDDDEDGPKVFRKSDTDAKIKVAYTTDTEVLADEGFYISLRINNYHFVVLEDIDFKLKPREDDNELMHKFLAMSDGFVSSNCKIVMSTNLSIGDIDPALTRPGRCYASIETRKLSSSEAQILLKKLEKEVVLDPRKEYTLADVYSLAYHLTYNESDEKKIGFRSAKK